MRPSARRRTSTDGSAQPIANPHASATGFSEPRRASTERTREAAERVAGRPTMARAEHIRRRADFQRVYQQGARLQGRYMTIFLLATELPVARLGITATKKLGGSVKRNHAKRLIREVFRCHKPAPGTDLVVIPRPTLPEAPLASLEADYRQTLSRRLSIR